MRHEHIIVLFGVIIVCMFGMLSTAAAENFTIVGSGDGLSVFEAVAAAFNHLHPDVTFTFPESIGSGGGIKAVGRDEYVLGRIARDIQENEKPYGLTAVPFAKAPVVFFVNPNVGVTDLSAQQILDIYSGKITNWKEAGGSDLPVRVIMRDEGDSSHKVLQQNLPGFKALTMTPNAKTTFSIAEILSTAEHVAGAIGYGNYANVRIANVTIIRIDGKNPTDSDYPYHAIQAFIFKEQNYTGMVKTFIEFLTSGAADDAIIQGGGIPFTGTP
ncbi:hypothetical protein U14_03108 [Candidatus Moduliflexus flocculans]|uniref:PBP domain-containing protein n=1 Tax=Candidatus Moduliflexus flocculans TaxID=1499966 RepID=A0A081BN96_9BACT|nr:hypothetical protein U14_03108 [Candidatus Moduliflexus flocculans]